jgi:16S rRNA G966 N2-methylase RsmD
MSKKISIKSTIKLITKLVKIIKKDKDDEYDYSTIILSQEEDINNTTTKTRYVFNCPSCNFRQSITYNLTESFLSNRTNVFCINNNCDYFQSNKKYGTYDIQNICNNRKQTLLSTKYKNTKENLIIQCNICNHIQEVKFLIYIKSYICENPNCELNKSKIIDGNIQINYSKYDSELKFFGFKILTEYKNQLIPCLFECENKHQFESKLEIFRNITRGKKKSNFCQICDKISSWNKLLEDLELIGITKSNIISTIDKFDKRTISNIDLKCDYGHITYDKKITLLLNIKDKIFNCSFCAKEDKIKHKELLVKEKLQQYLATFIKWDEDDEKENKLFYQCQCGNEYNIDYRNIVCKKITTCCINCIQEDDIIINKNEFNNKKEETIFDSGKYNTNIYKGHDDIIKFLINKKEINENEIIEKKKIKFESIFTTYEPSFILNKTNEIIIIDVKTRHMYEKTKNRIENLLEHIMNSYKFYIIYILELNGKSITKKRYTKLEEGGIYHITSKIYDDSIYSLYSKYKVKLTKEQIQVDIRELDFLDEYFTNSNFKIPIDILIEIRKKVKSHSTYLDNLLIKLLELTNKEFPIDFIDRSNIEKSYLSLKNDNTEIDKNLNIMTKTISILFLNYYTLDNILKAKNYDKKNLYELWKDKYKRNELIKKTILNCKGDFTPMKIIRTYGYTMKRLYNFPPNIAKCIYNTFEAKRVLDFCSGYGGRLVGFWASDATEYVGIDPNTEIMYNNIYNHLKYMDNKTKIVNIINKPAEDVEYDKLGYFDLIFTSPPYYNLEIYSEEETQSCNRYKTYDDWKTNFLFNVIEKVTNCLLPNGFLIINIKNIIIKNKSYNIADDMLEYIKENIKCIKLSNVIKMIQPKINKNKNYECIYVFRKYSTIIFN